MSEVGGKDVAMTSAGCGAVLSYALTNQLLHYGSKLSRKVGQQTSVTRRAFSIKPCPNYPRLKSLSPNLLTITSIKIRFPHLNNIELLGMNFGG